MDADSARDAAVMLIAGMGIPVLAALNAALGSRLGSPIAATCVLFAVALIVATVVLAVAGEGLDAVARVVGAPPHLFLAGALIAFYVLSITWIAPRFGVGNAIMFVLLGQMLSAAAIDHFALFSAIQRPLSTLRALGLTLMAIGLIVAQRG